MLYHQKCNNQLFIDITKYLSIHVMFGIGRESLVVGSGEITLPEDNFPSVFVCHNCKKEVPIGEVFTICMNCGKEIRDLSAAFKPNKSNGVYCTDCIRPFTITGESTVPLAKVINTIKVRR